MRIYRKSKYIIPIIRYDIKSDLTKKIFEINHTFKKYLYVFELAMAMHGTMAMYVQLPLYRKSCLVVDLSGAS